MLFWLFFALIVFVAVKLKWETLTTILGFISSWSPTIVLLILFKKIYPEDTRTHFIKRQFCNRFKISDVIIPISIFVFTLTGMILYRKFIDKIPFSLMFISSPAALIMVFIKCIFSGALSEELGWRSYLLAEFQKSISRFSQH
jgi:membrane protease YdiL (CAAX protease family)